jgi:lipopolysaccharide/colanic/teichoic acid biosynthesis glycosyltransferase
MQIVIIHRNHCASGQCGIFPMAVAGEPFATITLKGLMSANTLGGSKQEIIIAVPKEWQCKFCVEGGIRYYEEDVPISYGGVGKCGGVGNGGEKRWVVITNGRFVTSVEAKWLFGILADINADVVTVNVCPELMAFREKVRLTSQGDVAGFCRLYSDTAENAARPVDWPHHLFINVEILEKFLEKGTISSSFLSGFSQVLTRIDHESLHFRSINIGGSVLDLETENGFLSFVSNSLDARWPKNFRGYMQIHGANNAVVSEEARVFGKVLLGQDVHVGPGAIILGPAVIGDNVRIEQGAVVKSSVIGAGVTVPKKHIVQNRVITSDGRLNDKRLSKENGYGPLQYDVASRTPGWENGNGTFRIWSRFSYARFFKRIFDIISSTILIILFAPVLPFLAMAVKFNSSGPVFYKARRQGLYGKEFHCLKFRTMMTGADSIQSRLQAMSEVDGPQFKIEDDPRITTVGRFLRDTYLDEIPQFFNVLVGQMSLIGPRPSPEKENSLCPPWRDARLSVRPGITGLWQICRTRQEGQDFQEWIYYDTKYVKGLSVGVDLWVCWKTVKKLVKGFVKQF